MNTVTPIVVERLSFHLSASNYDADLADKLIVGFTSGFPIGHDHDPNQFEFTPRAITNDQGIILQEKINHEVRLGRIMGPYDSPPFDKCQISPVSLREKSTPGTYRLLHNLSYPYDELSVNYNISDQYKSVKYSSINDAIQILSSLPRGSYLAKTDISDAFRLMPLQQSDYSKLGMIINGKYYFDKNLPMGASSSCNLFESFSSAIHHIFKHYANKAIMLHYLDDFLIIANSAHECKLYLELFLSLCRDMGIPMSSKKTTLPSQTTTFLGIELDTINGCARLPIEKVTSYAIDVHTVLGLRTIRKRALQSIIGKLSFAATVVPARAFLRRLINLLSTANKPHHYITLNKESRLDLHTWYTFLHSYNGITFFRLCDYVDCNVINMCSDASKFAFGATFRNEWIQATYPPAWSNLHITILELYPIFVMISMFGHKLRNANIRFYSDNMGVVYIINNQSSSNSIIMGIVRPLILQLIKCNIFLRCIHIPGVHNIICDKISRFQITIEDLHKMHMSPLPTNIPDRLLPENFVGR